MTSDMSGRISDPVQEGPAAAEAFRLFVLAGAGLSAESGVPTFRSAGGLWHDHDVSKVCDLRSWKSNFDLVHSFYSARRTELARVVPNAAHEMVARWTHNFDCRVLTTNVDDLLERAGARGVVHLHGRLTEMHCTACGRIWDIGYRAFGENERCPKCSSRRGVKPGVVFFHEIAPNYALLRRETKALDTETGLVVVIGTSGEVVSVNEILNTASRIGRGGVILRPDAILANLEPDLREPPAINESLFSRTLYGPVAAGSTELDALVRLRATSGRFPVPSS